MFILHALCFENPIENEYENYLFAFYFIFYFVVVVVRAHEAPRCTQGVHINGDQITTHTEPNQHSFRTDHRAMSIVGLIGPKRACGPGAHQAQ